MYGPNGRLHGQEHLSYILCNTILFYHYSADFVTALSARPAHDTNKQINR